jgi:hypothetical protein
MIVLDEAVARRSLVSAFEDDAGTIVELWGQRCIPRAFDNGRRRDGA